MKARNAKPQSANALYCSMKFVASVRSFQCSWSKPLCVILVNLLKLTMDPFVSVMTYLVTYLVEQHSKTWKTRKHMSWRPTARVPIDAWSPLPYFNFPTTWGHRAKVVHLGTPNEQTDKHDWKHYLLANYVSELLLCYREWQYSNLNRGSLSNFPVRNFEVIITAFKWILVAR